MIRRHIAHFARMDGAEIAWRGTAAARTLVDRTRAGIARPRWMRERLLPALAQLDDLTAVRTALGARRWEDAHRELTRHFAGAPLRFTINPLSRPALTARISREFPTAAHEAAARADRILEGKYDLLGYDALRFEPPPTRRPDSERLDWHLDPVHGRYAPLAFWSAVPYLDPAIGDHKIIWELNRHQHWLTLGRAYWLTDRSAYRDRFLLELESWLEANPPLIGVNWASMLEIGFRSLSWLWAINLFADARADDDAWPWLVDLLAALDRQLEHVERNLSRYFSPNTHLLGEALALYTTGLALPELAASARRVRVGRRILLEEIERQIAADGGHSERSTHYHRYALDFYTLALIVARNADDDAQQPMAQAVVRLAGAARLLANGGGRMPHFGDDDGGVLTPIVCRDADDVRSCLAVAAALLDRPDLAIGNASEDMLWMLGPAVPAKEHQASWNSARSAALPDTGYYVSRSTESHHLVIDGGVHGCQNAGHAHADALSLTLAVRGGPLLIDPGTACYTVDPALRDRMRSTALHNTLTLDGRSQSIPAGPFHWSHVAKVRVHAWQANDAFDYFDGSHDGYSDAVHRRRVLALHGDLIVIADLVDGRGTHGADVHWHLDPRWTVRTRPGGAVFVSGSRGGHRVGLAVTGGAIDCVAGTPASALGWWSPAYGRLEPTTTVKISHEGAAPFWMVSVFDLDEDNPVTCIEWLPVWDEVGPLAHGAAVRIIRAESIDHAVFAEPGGARGLYRVRDQKSDARMLFYRESTKGRPCVGLRVS